MESGAEPERGWEYIEAQQALRHQQQSMDTEDASLQQSPEEAEGSASSSSESEQETVRGSLNDASSQFPEEEARSNIRLDFQADSSNSATPAEHGLAFGIPQPAESPNEIQDLIPQHTSSPLPNEEEGEAAPEGSVFPSPQVSEPEGARAISPIFAQPRQAHPLPDIHPWTANTVDVTGSSASASSSIRVHAPPRHQHSGAQASKRLQALSKLKDELTRLKTFSKWAGPKDIVTELARAGFFCFGQGSQAQCVFCLIIIGRWEPQENPFLTHKVANPKCRFVRRMPVGNVPRIPELGPTPYPEPFSSLRPDEGLGYEDYGPPQEPRYRTYESRICTFTRWPRSNAVDARDLAAAGFTYTERTDLVRCFHCDGGLRYWERNSDPWKEHARWFPDCQYIRLIKGRSYIVSAQQGLKENTPGAYPQRSIGSISEENETELPSEIRLRFQGPQQKASSGKDSYPQETVCRLCLSAEGNIALIPCGHTGFCAGCFSAMGPGCPICRVPHQKYLRIYF
jgi:hypothetical protein